MANLIEEAISIVSNFIGNELSILDTAEGSLIVDQLNNIAITPSVILNERDRLSFERNVNENLDGDFVSFLSDCAIDLHLRLESMEAGSYDRLVGLISRAANLVNNSSLVPEEWKQETSDVYTIGHVLRFLLGYVMRDIDLGITEGPGAE